MSQGFSASFPAFPMVLHAAAIAAKGDPVLTFQLVDHFVKATSVEPYYKRFSRAYGTGRHDRALKLEK